LMVPTEGGGEQALASPAAGTGSGCSSWCSGGCTAKGTTCPVHAKVKILRR
jgi:hypothetical protein